MLNKNCKICNKKLYLLKNGTYNCPDDHFLISPIMIYYSFIEKFVFKKYEVYQDFIYGKLENMTIYEIDSIKSYHFDNFQGNFTPLCDSDIENFLILQ